MTKPGECIHCGKEAEMCIDCGVLNEVMDEAIVMAAKVVRDRLLAVFSGVEWGHTGNGIRATIKADMGNNDRLAAIVKLTLESPRLTPPPEVE